MWVPLAHPLLGTWPTTHTCALTRNRTSDPLVCRSALNPLSHTSQGHWLIIVRALTRDQFTTFLMSLYLTAFFRWQVGSTTDTLGVGAQKAMPMSFLIQLGDDLCSPSAITPQRPRRATCGSWTMAWTMVTSPSTMSKLSWMTVPRGTKQLVVQKALLATLGSCPTSVVHTHHRHGGICSRSKDDG